MVSRNIAWEMGEDFSTGPEGPDRSLLAHCLREVKGYGYPPLNPDGWAVEFGTGSGDTTRMIASVMPVVSFDSFEGLPEDWRPGFDKGKFGQYQMPTDIAGATIVPGWFEDTAIGYDFPDWVALVHMDADLYSSTATAFDAVGGHIGRGTIIVFDEFFGYEGCEQHEQRAWYEFVQDFSVQYDVIGHGREQWAARIKAIR
jgi:hypothetical protein